MGLGATKYLFTAVVIGVGSIYLAIVGTWWFLAMLPVAILNAVLAVRSIRRDDW